MLHTSNDIRNPGLRTLPPGVERFFVKGGGLSLIEVLPEDKIEIINDEGQQICEVVVFNSHGKSDLSILSLKENSNADFSKITISNDEKISKIPPITWAITIWLDQLWVGITIGFLLSAALDIPAKLTTEITRADINDTIFFIIFSPSILSLIAYVLTY